MAELTDDSPATYATPKATSPASRPASRPLTRKSRAEVMARISGRGSRAGCTLLSRDEVPGDQEQDRCKDQPRKHLGERERRSCNCNRLGVGGPRHQFF